VLFARVSKEYPWYLNPIGDNPEYAEKSLAPNDYSFANAYQM
jgi:hypothetical protein